MTLRAVSANDVALADPRSDAELVAQIVAGDVALFEVLMRRYNARVYRAVRAILSNEAEVEDAMQQAYLQAFRHLSGFAAASSLATWLIRIAMNEALMRRRREKRTQQVLGDIEAASSAPSRDRSLERTAEARDLVRMLERAVDALPDDYRTVLVLRTLDGLSTAETAEVLSLNADAVKTRLHRARTQLQKILLDLAGQGADEAFAFHASRCDRVVAAVLGRLQNGAPSP